MLVDKTIFMKKEVSLMSTSMADMTYQLKISNMRHHIIELYINLYMNRTFFNINMHNSLSVPIMELGSKNHFVNTWMQNELENIIIGLKYSIQGKFWRYIHWRGLAAKWLGSHNWPATEPSSHETIIISTD